MPVKRVMAPTRSVPELLKQSEHHDKDERFMAISDLVALVESGNVRFDSSTQTRICTSVLKRLEEDQSNDVQSITVKCLSTLAEKFDDEHTANIVRRMANLVLNSQKSELRDIYSIGLKTVLQSLKDSSDDGAASSSSLDTAIALLDTLLDGIASRVSASTDREDHEVLPVCVELVGDLLRKYRHQLKLAKIDALTKAHLPALQHHNSSVRSRVATVLGQIAGAHHITTDRYNNLMEHVVKQVENNFDSLRASDLMALSAVARNGGARASVFVATLLPLLNRCCEKDDIEVREQALHSLDAVLSAASPSSSTKEAAAAAVHTCVTLMAHDPNYSYGEDAGAESSESSASELMQDDGWGAEDDGFGGGDDGWGDEDGAATGGWDDAQGGSNLYDFTGASGDIEDDDTNWKVRRAALQALPTALMHAPQCAAETAAALINRFKERDANVRQDVFDTFSKLIARNSSVVDATSAVETLAKHFDSPGTRAVSHTGALRVARGMLRANLLHAEHWPSLQPMVMRVLSDAAPSKAAAGADVDGVIAALDVVLLALRVCSDALLDSVSELVPVMRSPLEKLHTRALTLRVLGELAQRTQRELETTFDMVMPLLQQTDAEQTVKDAAADAMGRLLCMGGTAPLASKIAQKNVLQLLLDRLNNETTRVAVLRVLQMVAHAVDTTSVDLSPLVPAVCEHVAELLRKSQQSLRHEASATLLTLSEHATLARLVPQQSIEAAAAFVDDKDLFVASHVLRSVQALLPLGLNCPSLLLERVVMLAKSPLLQRASLSAVLGFLAAYMRQQGSQTPQLSQLREAFVKAALEASAGVDRKVITHTCAKCVATLVTGKNDVDDESVALDAAVVKDIVTRACQGNGFWLRVLGEIGLRADLSSDALSGGQLMQRLFDVMDSSSNDGASTSSVGSTEEQSKSATKWDASFALGAVACGNVPVLLPQLLALLEESSKGQQAEHFLLLNAVRTVIARHLDKRQELGELAGADHALELLRQAAPQLVPLLLKQAAACGNEDAGVVAMVAECLGRFVVVDPRAKGDAVRAIVQCGSPDQPVSARAVAAVAFKYVFGDKTARDTFFALNASMSEENEELLPTFERLLIEDEVDVRRRALMSLCIALDADAAAVATNGRLMRYLKSTVTDAVTVKPELIREVDMGPFKHTIDDGLELRKAGFAVIERIIEKVLRNTALSQKLSAEELPTLSTIVPLLQKGMNDPDSDVQYLVFQMLYKLASSEASSTSDETDHDVDSESTSCATALVPFLDSFSTPLLTSIKALIKKYKELERDSGEGDGKAQTERFVDTLRTAVKFMFHAQQAPGAESAERYQKFYVRVTKTKLLMDILVEYKAKCTRFAIRR
ncbi:MAG: hypothetical protein MHM6MM_004436 [Cercozoa sp. M6MM]